MRALFLPSIWQGGTLIVLGLNRDKNQDIVSDHCATGMHGGKIYVRGEVPEHHISPNISVSELNEEENEELLRCIKKILRSF